MDKYRSLRKILGVGTGQIHKPVLLFFNQIAISYFPWTTHQVQFSIRQPIPLGIRIIILRDKQQRFIHRQRRRQPAS
jgi:hypothetical protein